jgi:hypothetical protein
MSPQAHVGTLEEQGTLKVTGFQRDVLAQLALVYCNGTLNSNVTSRGDYSASSSDPATRVQSYTVAGDLTNFNFFPNLYAFANWDTDAFCPQGIYLVQSKKLPSKICLKQLSKDLPRVRIVLSFLSDHSKSGVNTLRIENGGEPTRAEVPAVDQSTQRSSSPNS